MQRTHTHAQLQLTSLNLLCPLYALVLHTQHAHNVELTYLEPGYGALGSLPAFRDLPVRIVRRGRLACAFTLEFSWHGAKYTGIVEKAT